MQLLIEGGVYSIDAKWACGTYTRPGAYPRVARKYGRSILSQGNVSHEPKLGVFTVMGMGGNADTIRLFPTESCTCPSTSQCYYILATKVSIGKEDKQSHHRIHLI